MDEARLNNLITFLATAEDGFANWCIWRSELLAVLQELRQYREGAHDHR